jgi:tetratricopeptide (TPR) repeat protein
MLAEVPLSEVSARREEIKSALERILAWPEIARSPQLARFLDYIVRRSLDGEEQSIKAYSIAVDVFGRQTDFDPQADPIVRVQARRLRGLLEQYYGGPGADDIVRIELPVGRYVPEFVFPIASGGDQGVALAPVPPTIELAARGHVTVSWFVLLVIALGAAALAFSLSTWGPRQESLTQAAGALQRPRLTVVEFQNLTGEPAKLLAASGLAMEVVTDLEAFDTVNVRFAGSPDALDADAVPSDFILNGLVRRDPAEPGGLQYSVSLTDRSSDSVVWSRAVSVAGPAIGDRWALDDVSMDLVAALGSMRGPVHGRARELLAQYSIEGQENAYLCRMLFDIYRDTSAFSAAERAQACFGKLIERDRQTGPVLAAVASLTAELARATPPSERAERLARASELMADALRRAPTNAFVWEQRARLYELMGEHDNAEAAYGSSLQLNPASMDALAARARHLALIGRLQEAAPMARRTIEGAPSPPRWYMAVPALEALSKSDYEAALQYAEIYSQSDRELGPIFAILAAQGLGDGEIVNLYLPRVLEVPSFRANGILPHLRARIADGQFITRVRRSLEAAGVQAAALTGPF